MPSPNPLARACTDCGAKRHGPCLDASGAFKPECCPARKAGSVDAQKATRITDRHRVTVYRGPAQWR